MKRSPINPMSDRRRAALAAAGVVRPFSTLTPGVGIQRAAVKPKRARYTGPPPVR